jgi:sarcosine oxidase
VLLASACSGHGFKHSAAVGEILSELVEQGRSTIRVGPFSLDRFA